jgi:hypothetical protein
VLLRLYISSRVVVSLDFNLAYIMLTFSLTHHGSVGGYSFQSTGTSTSVILVFSLSQHHHSRLNHFKIYFVDNEFEKAIA